MKKLALSLFLVLVVLALGLNEGYAKKKWTSEKVGSKAAATEKTGKKKSDVTPKGSVTVEDVQLTAAEVMEDAKNRPKMTKWEYMAVDIKHPEKEKHRRKWNALGREGWRLVGVRMKAGDTDAYIFMRPVIDED